MRGIMTFDDYNYRQLNQYVLIEEPGEKERRLIQQDREQILTQKLSKEKAGQSSRPMSTLSKENLYENASNYHNRKGGFMHDSISIPLSEKEVLEAQIYAQEEKQRQIQMQIEKAFVEVKVKQPSEDGSDKEEAHDSDQLELIEAKDKKEEAPVVAVDPFEYKIFFEQQEIEKVKEKQNEDLFEDLIMNRSQAKFESSCLFGGDRIDIA